MIRYGIIGRGFITDMMLSAMAAVPEAAKPDAICSRSLADAEAFRRAHNLSFACDSLTELADYPGIDAVYIASPNACHYDQAKCMLEHGKHVLCEKPAASNAAQVRGLVRLAEEKGLIFLEAMRPVFSDTLRIVRENLPRIGTLRRVRLDYCKPSSRLSRFLAGEHVNTFDPALSNAAVMDLGCYGIHSIVHLFGRPEAVSAQAVHLENGFEALGTVLMRYPGFTAEVSYSKIHRLDSPCLFNGEAGTIYLDNINFTQKVWLRMNDGTEEDLHLRTRQPDDTVCIPEAFDRFVTKGIRPAAENRNSIITAGIIDEARHQTGTVFPSDTLR